MEYNGPPLPKTSVSYSTTESFRDAFPDEVEAQNIAFRERSWEHRLEAEVNELIKDVPVRKPITKAVKLPFVAELDTANIIVGAGVVAVVAVFSFLAVKYFLQE